MPTSRHLAKKLAARRRYAAIGVTASELRRRLRQGESVLDVAQYPGDKPR